jgi:hypothetical protein
VTYEADVAHVGDSIVCEMEPARSAPGSRSPAWMWAEPARGRERPATSERASWRARTSARENAGAKR